MWENCLSSSQVTWIHVIQCTERATLFDLRLTSVHCERE